MSTLRNSSFTLQTFNIRVVTEAELIESILLLDRFQATPEQFDPFEYWNNLPWHVKDSQF